MAYSIYTPQKPMKPVEVRAIHHVKSLRGFSPFRARATANLRYQFGVKRVVQIYSRTLTPQLTTNKVFHAVPTTNRQLTTNKVIPAVRTTNHRFHLPQTYSLPQTYPLIHDRLCSDFQQEHFTRSSSLQPVLRET